MQEKPGYLTTEFWLSAAAILIGGLIASDIIPIGSDIHKVLIFASTVLSALGYTLARGFVKGRQAAGSALVEASRANPQPPPVP